MQEISQRKSMDEGEGGMESVMAYIYTVGIVSTMTFYRKSIRQSFRGQRL